MAVVACVLLNHVRQHPPERDASLATPGGVRPAERPALTMAELPAHDRAGAADPAGPQRS